MDAFTIFFWVQDLFIFQAEVGGVLFHIQMRFRHPYEPMKLPMDTFSIFNENLEGILLVSIEVLRLYKICLQNSLLILCLMGKYVYNYNVLQTLATTCENCLFTFVLPPSNQIH